MGWQRASWRWCGVQGSDQRGAGRHLGLVSITGSGGCRSVCLVVWACEGLGGTRPASGAVWGTEGRLALPCPPQHDRG